MMAYQVYGRWQFELKPIIEASIAEIYKDAPISAAIILDLAPEIGVERQKAAGKKFDVMESMSLEARGKIREGFLEVAKSLPQAKVIDASRSIEEVYKDVRQAVEETLK